MPAVPGRKPHPSIAPLTRDLLRWVVAREGGGFSRVARELKLPRPSLQGSLDGHDGLHPSRLLALVRHLVTPAAGSPEALHATDATHTDLPWMNNARHSTWNDVWWMQTAIPSLVHPRPPRLKQPPLHHVSIDRAVLLSDLDRSQRATMLAAIAAFKDALRSKQDGGYEAVVEHRVSVPSPDGPREVIIVRSGMDGFPPERRKLPYRHNVAILDAHDRAHLAMMSAGPWRRRCREHRRGDRPRSCADCEAASERQSWLRFDASGVAWSRGLAAPLAAFFVHPYCARRRRYFSRVDVAFDVDDSLDFVMPFQRPGRDVTPIAALRLYRSDHDLAIETMDFGSRGRVSFYRKRRERQRKREEGVRKGEPVTWFEDPPHLASFCEDPYRCEVRLTSALLRGWRTPDGAMDALRGFTRQWGIADLRLLDRVTPEAIALAYARWLGWTLAGPTMGEAGHVLARRPIAAAQRALARLATNGMRLPRGKRGAGLSGERVAGVSNVALADLAEHGRDDQRALVVARGLHDEILRTLVALDEHPERAYDFATLLDAANESRVHTALETFFGA
jgi:hypothetical protein